LHKNAGETWEDKVSRIIIEVEKKKANGLVISNSQDIAWITNLRSSAQFVPTFKSYIFINTTSRSLTIYLNPQRVKDEVSTHLGTDYQNCTRRFCVEIRPYNAFLEELFWIGKESSNKIFIPDDTNFASYVTVPEENRVCGISPVARLKAVKNAIEIEGMRQASIRDSIAFIESMAIISRDLVDKGTTDWDETTVSKLLSTQRKSLPNNRGDSFPAIVAVGPHAAKAHHRPNNASRTFVSRDEILLIDTGGQYLDGTTDVSRCFHFETPSDIEKEAYTRVLMGVIDLTTTKFPSGISAAHIPDAVARRHLLEAGLQYDHGTGHGIGVYLDPHENSIYIGSETGFKVDAGMITSIEPGYYEAGRFGVRIENVVLITRADVYSKPHANDNRANNNFNNSSKSREFLTFETLTLVPLEPKLIKTSLLTWKHRKWINEYNSKIRKIVGKELKRLQKFDALKWMNEKTSVIPEGDCHFTSPKRDFAKEGDLRSLSPKPSTFFSSLLYNEFWFFTSSTFLLTFLLPPLIGH
jgi:Xaa-Pro aminopeptidase